MPAKKKVLQNSKGLRVQKTKSRIKIKKSAVNFDVEREPTGEVEKFIGLNTAKVARDGGLLSKQDIKLLQEAENGFRKAIDKIILSIGMCQKADALNAIWHLFTIETLARKTPHVIADAKKYDSRRKNKFIAPSSQKLDLAVKKAAKAYHLVPEPTKEFMDLTLPLVQKFLGIEDSQSNYPTRQILSASISRLKKTLL
jgi:hypothetical protein